MKEVQASIFEFIPDPDKVPKMPEEYKGKTNIGCGYTKSQPREWTENEIEWVQQLHKEGYTAKEIAESVDRTDVSVKIKLKRLTKIECTYNQDHIADKYATNQRFIEHIKPQFVCDAFAGIESFYTGKCGCVTNDKNNEAKTTYHLDALKFMCLMYYKGLSFDIVDLDPFGSAFDCFDLAIKMAKKGIVITFGEIGHKRWKRLDYVSRYYNINSLEEFTLDNLIQGVQEIGRRNKKNLIVYEKKEWRNIGRVWFDVEPIKITEQWSKK